MTSSAPASSPTRRTWTRSRAGRRLRRAGGLPPPHRRSGARHRRAHHPCHPRYRADRLSGRGGSRQHAAAGGAPPARRHALPCIGDGRQSGTSGSPSILNASPEAAAGGGLSLVRTGDRIRVDLNKRSANLLLPDDELARRRSEVKAKLGNGGLGYVPHSQTPWQEIQRDLVDQFDHGMVLKSAVKYQRLAQTMGVPRDNH